jgi:hypothetical protein
MHKVILRVRRRMAARMENYNFNSYLPAPSLNFRYFYI